MGSISSALSLLQYIGRQALHAAATAAAELPVSRFIYRDMPDMRAFYLHVVVKADTAGYIRCCVRVYAVSVARH